MRHPDAAMTKGHGKDSGAKEQAAKKPASKKPTSKKAAAKKPAPKKSSAKGKAGEGLGDVLDRLWELVEERHGADPAGSYTARLFARGRAKIAQKLGEEAVEAVIEGVRGDKPALVRESADLLYHLIVLWADTGVAPADVAAELGRREGRSGIAEKHARRGGAKE
jgi:phosphoribosyl-ATP pyrophosphohydrolase